MKERTTSQTTQRSITIRSLRSFAFPTLRTVGDFQLLRLYNGFLSFMAYRPSLLCCVGCCLCVVRSFGLNELLRCSLVHWLVRSFVPSFAHRSLVGANQHGDTPPSSRRHAVASSRRRVFLVVLAFVYVHTSDRQCVQHARRQVVSHDTGLVGCYCMRA